MRLVITGGTGFIGSTLCARLLEQGHVLTLLSRLPYTGTNSPRKEWMTWEPGSPGAWERTIDGVDGIINLAGEPIAAKRWTVKQKKKIRSSRIGTTRALVKAIREAKDKPKVLLNASAIGYYGPHGEETLTEKSELGRDFLSEVCHEWEGEAQNAEEYGVRVVRLRTGIVLGPGGGALAKMVPPFKLFTGGPLGTGRQWMSWIQMEDEVGLILFLLENPNAQGAFNATAPNPVTMREFCKTLGQVLHRPSWAPVPSFVLRLLLGEMADLVLYGQRVLPTEAQRLGYTFKYPNPFEALEACMPL